MIVRHPVLVIAAWLVIAGSLFAALPPLITVAQRNPPGFLPEESPVLATSQQMKDAFNEAGATVLDDFDNELRWFVKVMPTYYRRALEHQAEIEERAKQLSERQAAAV